MARQPDLQPVRSPQSERFTVTLIPAAVQELSRLMSVTGLSKTDAINRAVQVYAFLAAEMDEGKELLLRDNDGALERVHIV
ncbi:hypothetical protein [Kitasatospora kifunensis]|uniref:Ribbon-helix-helix protein CopG domain-containing protein n=1 Tax=Kitasatospora kifunensis TaxID=58351 RepID=A0A7W7W0P0_KITKI|nr:hypothetical protein [Kitasatospora kifunensis]MBB4928845.1 hypothetical protein [Kitasatospora kifunensis]